MLEKRQVDIIFLDHLLKEKGEYYKVFKGLKT